MMTIEEAITRSYLAEGLPPDDVAYLVASAEARSFNAEELLMRQHEQRHDLMILIQGSARIMTHNGEYLGDLHPGDIFGELALIDQRPRSASIVANTTGEVAILSAERWNHILRERPELAVVLLTNLCRAICAKLRSTTRWLDSALLRN